MSLTRDPYFVGALLIGPLFWVIYSGLESVTLDKNWDSERTWLFVQVAFIYPVLEEVVFRGGLQGRILQPRLYDRKWHGISLANIVTSLAFAFFHLLNHDLSWAVAVFFPSLVFGFLFDRYRSLVPPIMMHILYNSGFFILFV